MTEDTNEFLPPPYLYKKDEIVIPSDDPWKNDLLGRKDHAEKLAKIIEPIKQPFVMTLSAEFGMGKTTFIKCWHQDLKDQQISSVIFNAWETDHSKDAFAAFVASIEEQLPNDKAKKKLLVGAKKLGGAMLKNAPSLLAKIVTKALVGEDAVKVLGKIQLSENDLVETFEGIASDAFEGQKATQSAIENFKIIFEEIIEKHCDGRLIIFVDELDRCRPNYSVEVLERIKHIFSVKGAIYILAVDHQQLLNSISGVYGAQIDAQRYLRRFIDWDYTLPAPSIGRYSNYLYYQVFSFDKQNMFMENDKVHNGGKTFLSFLNLFASIFNSSLRDLDQYFTYLNLVWQIKPKNYYPMEIALAAFFKVCVPQDYENLINWEPNGQFTESPIQKHILKIIENFDNSPADISPNYYFIGWIIALFSCSASKESEKYVCVSGVFLDKALPDKESIDNGWVIGMLKTSHFENSFPSIKIGLKSLNEINV